jgi:hypothetical protein
MGNAIEGLRASQPLSEVGVEIDFLTCVTCWRSAGFTLSFNKRRRRRHPLGALPTYDIELTWKCRRNYIYRVLGIAQNMCVACAVKAKIFVHYK